MARNNRRQAVSAQRAFAQLLAKDDRAGVLNAHNALERWSSIEQSITNDDAFFITVSDDIVAIDSDFDDPSRADEFVECLKAHNLKPVVLDSGQAGHRHVFARIADTALRNFVSKEAKRLGLDLRQTIRPPQTLHRDGTKRSVMLEPSEVDDAIAILMGCDSEQLLSSRSRVLLRYGDVANRYPHPSEKRSDRSAIIFKITCDAINHGMTFEQLIQAFLDQKNVGGERIRQEEQRKQGGGHDYLKRTWRKANTAAFGAPAALYGKRALVVLNQCAANAALLTWPVRTGATTRAVYDAHIVIARKSKRLTYCVSSRQLAELANVTARTARAANERLIKMDLIRRIPSVTETSEWLIRPCVTAPLTRSHPPLYKERDWCLNAHAGGHALDLDISHDAFHRDALGKSAHQIATSMLNGNTIAKAIAGETGLHRTTVQRNINKMITAGLVTIDDDGNVAIDHLVNLDEIAAAFGATGRGEARRQRHKIEREIYTKFQERKAKQSQAPTPNTAPSHSSACSIPHRHREPSYRSITP